VRGLDLHQEIYICRHRLTPQPRIQAAFWDFLSDPGNPVIKKITSNQAIN
jgi:hypothetical protein